MKKGVYVLALLFALSFTPKAFAEGGDVWEMAQSQHYGTKFGGMLGRGIVNFATCFVDIIVQTVNGTQDGPPFIGTMTGLGSGLGCTALRATSGALDIVTSWVPGFNGIPVSRSYANCLEVEEDAVSAPAESAPSAPAVAERRVEPKQDAMEYVKK